MSGIPFHFVSGIIIHEYTSMIVSAGRYTSRLWNISSSRFGIPVCGFLFILGFIIASVQYPIAYISMNISIVSR